MDSDELSFRIKELESLIEDEERKRLAFRVNYLFQLFFKYINNDCKWNLQKENVRRKHNYLPLIMELLKSLAEEGKLVDGVKQIGEKKKTRRSKSIKKEKS